MTGSADRLPRLLALVPYLRTHPGAELAEVAAVFGVDVRQLNDDLNLLWVCGLPGGGPGDLIDFAFEGDTVSVIEAQTLDRPLRLTADEALALRVAARALADVPGLAERDALESAQAKLAIASGACRASGPRLGPSCRSRSSPRPRRWRPSAARSTRAARSSCDTSSPPATRSPSAPSTRCGWSASTAAGTSRAGATSRRAFGSSGSTGWSRRASGARRRAAAVRSRPARSCRGAFPARARRTSPWCSSSNPQLAGSPTTTRSSRRPSSRRPLIAAGDGPGALRVELRTPDPGWVVRLALRLGGQGRVVSPPEVVAAVREKAEAALAALGGTERHPIGLTQIRRTSCAIARICRPRCRREPGADSGFGPNGPAGQGQTMAQQLVRTGYTDRG